MWICDEENFTLDYEWKYINQIYMCVYKYIYVYIYNVFSGHVEYDKCI